MGGPGFSQQEPYPLSLTRSLSDFCMQGNWYLVLKRLPGVAAEAESIVLGRALKSSSGVWLSWTHFTEPRIDGDRRPSCRVVRDGPACAGPRGSLGTAQ